MMDGPTRTPPRFVPTLTAVVDLQEEASAGASTPPPSSPALEPGAGIAPEAPLLEFPVPSAMPQQMPETALALELPPLPTLNDVVTPERPEPPVLTDVLPPAPGFEPAPWQAPQHVPPLHEASAFHDAAPAPTAMAQSAALPEPTPALAPFQALSPSDEADAFRLEEELLHRVLQRVDLSLEDRLTEVVSAAVQEQLDAMVPRLRQQVEVALRELVVEAMAHELSETPGSAAHSRTKLGLN